VRHRKLWGTAQEALGALKEREPELLIVAMHLPDMSGVEWVRRLRTTERYRHALVLMLADKADKEALFAATDAGINHMVAKPLSVLRSRVLICAPFGDTISPLATPPMHWPFP
ncbi:MAG: DNA-binding response OmpR family regulator, partial [Planctomycetota bacterium]